MPLDPLLSEPVSDPLTSLSPARCHRRDPTCSPPDCAFDFDFFTWLDAHPSSARAICAQFLRFIPANRRMY